MPIGEICNRNVIVSGREDTVADAAKLMREHHVGDVVVVDEREGRRFPVGIVTDRDLVVEIMATDLDQKVITVGDIMLEELVTVKESVGLFEAVQYMRNKAVRRLPVVASLFSVSRPAFIFREYHAPRMVRGRFFFAIPFFDAQSGLVD